MNPIDRAFELRLGGVERSFSGMSHGIIVILVVKGVFSLKYDGCVHILNADDVVLLGHRAVYALDAEDANLALILHVHGEYLERAFPALLRTGFQCDSSTHPADSQEKNAFFPIKRALIRMMLAYYKKEEGYELDVHRALLDLLYDAVKNFRVSDAGTCNANAIPHDAPPELAENDPIRRSLDFIRENYKSDVTLTAAAECANMSPQYFSKRFKQRMGCGFLAFLTSLRLESAAREVAYGGESILRVAINNGFAGSRSFSIAFKEVYGVTPREYRKTCAPQANTGEGIEAFWGAADTPDFEDLMKYIALYDIRHGYRTNASEQISVSLARDVERHAPDLVPPKKIFKIGRLSEALSERVREQILYAQKKFQADYIYFKGVYDDGIPTSPGGSYFKDYDYGRLIAYFFDVGLTPFINIDLACVPDLSDLFDLSNLSVFVAGLYGNYEAWRASSVLFEVTCSRQMDDEIFLRGYRAVYEIVKQRAPAAGVGCYSTSSDDRAEAEGCASRLAACVAMGCPPDFLTLTVDPAMEGDYESLLNAPEKFFENYGPRRIKRVRCIAAEQGLPEAPIFVSEWNTLSGRTSIESSAFFRAALIASELISFAIRADGVRGVAFWLNSRSKEALTGCVDNRVLALFFYGFVKRPAYHLLYFADRVYGVLVYRDEHLVVTQIGEGEYSILAHNPRYFNPLYSVDEAYVSMERLRIEARLTEVPAGKYRFKVFGFDKKHSVIFDKWGKTGYPNLNDPDVSEYLEHAVLPDFDIFDAEIDGTYTISPNLSYNSVALYLIKRID